MRDSGECLVSPTAVVSPTKTHYISFSHQDTTLSQHIHLFFSDAIEKLHNYICICIHTNMMLEVDNRQPIFIFCVHYVSNNLYLFLYFETLPLVPCISMLLEQFCFPLKITLGDSSK